MNATQLERKLKQEKETLGQLIEEIKKELGQVPEGYVRISKHRKGLQFYHIQDSKHKNGKYIPVKEKGKALSLVKKQYYKHLLDAAVKQYQVIDSFLKNYDVAALQKAFLSTSPIRQSLLISSMLPDPDSGSSSNRISHIPDSLLYAALPDALFAEIWEKQIYERKPFLEDAPIHYTRKKERVRSKSEVLIADALYKYGIPYRYECPLRLGKDVIHPDFTILRPEDRKILYWEHLGAMDEAGYARTALQRIEEYKRNGIFPGDQLILTSETSRMPLNFTMIERTIGHYILLL